MKLTIDTEIKLNAPVEKVWEIFTNFERYPEWNPFVKELKGEVKEGNQIEVALPGMNFKPIVLAYKPKKELIWKGKFLVKGLIDGQHEFLFNENPDGTTTLIHREKFSGILIRFLIKKLKVETKQGFEEMNMALKREVEQN